MKVISQIIASFCVSSIFIGALYILVPTGAISKSVKYALSLAFLISLIAATGLTVKNAEFEIPKIVTSAESTAELQIKSAEYTYSLALKKAEIDFDDIKIFTNKDELGSIEINRIEIYSRAPKEKILAALCDVAKNYEVEVINE